MIPLSGFCNVLENEAYSSETVLLLQVGDKTQPQKVDISCLPSKVNRIVRRAVLMADTQPPAILS